MPFDENLVLHDGTTITADISPTSTTRTNGSAVIDLKKTKVGSLYATLLSGESMAEGSPNIAPAMTRSFSAGHTPTSRRERLQTPQRGSHRTDGLTRKWVSLRAAFGREARCA